jgi:phosphoserine phosphatase RsbU/P
MSPDQIRATGERLALLYQLSQTFNSSLDLDEVLNRVMDEVISATRAERGFVMLKEDAFGGGEKLSFRVARGLDHSTIDDPEFQISRSIVERVAEEGQPVLTSDAQTDSRFNLRQSVMILGLRSILCVPLIVKERNLGVIYVDNRLHAGIFTQADLDLLSAIASSAAIAIENARLYQVAVEKGRMEQEMQMARRVQANLLPQRMPETSGWDYAALWRPARAVGGDYYDFIPGAGSSTGFLIADVTDKGMPAALFMAFTRSVVRASLYGAQNPAESMARANRIICEDSKEALFVSLFYGQIDPDSGTLTYVNAGHHPALFYQASSGKLEILSATGLPLGMEADDGYEQKALPFSPADFIVLYTDGVLDACSASGEDFGMESLQRTILEACRSSASGIVTALDRALEDFTVNAQPVDDITLLIVKRDPSSEV